MNLKQRILLRLRLFLNIKYSNLFFDLLRNIKQILIEENKEIKEKLFEFNNEKGNKNNFFYFQKILKTMHQNKTYKNYTFSLLEYLYLKNKAKLSYNKLNIIGKEVNKKTDFLIDFYIKLCKIELKEIKQDKIIKVKPKKTMNKFSYKSKTIGFHIDKKENKEEDEKKEFDNEEEEEEVNIEVEDDRTDVINLYIGKFDLKKILQKTQILKIKKGEFVNAFIFKDSEFKSQNNNKIVKFISPKKKVNKNVISPVKLYIEKKNNLINNYIAQKNNKEKNKIETNLNTFNFDDSENEKMLLENKIINKHKRNNIINNHLLTFSPKIHKRNYLSQNLFLSSNITNNDYINTNESSKRNLPLLNSLINKKLRKRNIKSSISPNTINYLCKNDLYY